MLIRLLGIGLDDSLDFEESIKVKLLNAVSFLFIIVSYIFIIKHLFFTHKYNVAASHFLASLTIPFIFILQYKKKYRAAKVIFFILLHSIIFISSMFLLLGQGVENFFIVNIILILILIKTRVWRNVLMVFNAFLFMSPQLFYHPYSSDNYSFVTYLVLFFSVILALRFFILIQDQFKERLRVQNEHLEKLNEEKNDLMSIVAHDLKNPLTQIKGLVSILELSNNELSQEQRQLIEKIKGVTDNQHKQITGFLDAKSFEDSFEESTFEKVAVRRIVETVLDEMLAQAIAKGIRLTYLKDAKRNLTIDGRKEWLFKIISNLVSNAVKFSSSGSEIFIEVKSTESQVIILVRDQGQGFSKDELKYIFRKNKILSATPTGNESSSGVGLYIVKKYVDQMHGWVTVESEEGKGSTFFVTLPR
jgi:signal transduction histidine kinase